MFFLNKYILLSLIFIVFSFIFLNSFYIIYVFYLSHIRPDFPKITHECLSDDPEVSKKAMKDFNLADTDTAINDLARILANSQADLSILPLYAEKERQLETKMNALRTAVQERNKSKQAMETLKLKRLQAFLDGFRVISMKLKELYQMLTLGGDAELELVDSMNPFSEGVTFSVKPPSKSWKRINNLSGGEKVFLFLKYFYLFNLFIIFITHFLFLSTQTLASMSLVLALHHYKPNPLYFMDEIDASLDKKNAAVVAQYIKLQAKNAQFVVISHTNNVFEASDSLIGVIKIQNSAHALIFAPNSPNEKDEKESDNMRPTPLAGSSSSSSAG